MFKKIYKNVNKLIVLVVLCGLYGCATYMQNEKIEVTHYEHLLILTAYNAYYDNKNKDILYVCLSGQKYINQHRIEKNREVEKNYVVTIDGFVSNEPYIPKAKIKNIKSIECKDYIEGKNVSKLNIYIAADYERSKTENLCTITNWEKIDIHNKKTPIPREQCNYSFNSKSMVELTTTLKDDETLDNGIYYFYKNDGVIKEGSTLITSDLISGPIRIKYNNEVYSFKISGERHKTNPMAPFLIPFTLIFDVITLPFQAIYFLTFYLVGGGGH